ncbi:unnamed protein product [Cochlearia groenlandica]
MLEFKVESSKAKDAELEAIRGTEAKLAAEVGVHVEHYKQLADYHHEEVDWLLRSRFYYVEAGRMQFDKLREALKARLGRLKLFLDEEEEPRTVYLLANKLKGIFEVFRKMEREYSVTPPAALVEALRTQEKELVQWLKSRPELTFSSSDF